MLGVSVLENNTSPTRKPTVLKRQVTFHDEIVMGNGLAVITHRKLEQGNHQRCVYLAQNARASSKQEKELYALKRIDCRDVKEELEKCLKEIKIHRTLTQLKSENLVPLIGSKVEKTPSLHRGNLYVCHMLLPYIPHSLRSDINYRHLLEDMLESRRKPYMARELLGMFQGILKGVNEMHKAGWCHRDLKPENILLQRKPGKHSKGEVGRIPVITDFGSAGPVTVPTETWLDIIHATEEADQTTTIGYRAPELFGGGLSFGPTESLHYAYSDVWSLGCVLFSMMYGASPFQTEWRVSLVEGAAAEGTIRLVECTRTKVLQSQVPFPPLGGAADRRYGEGIKDLVRCMLRKEGDERPSCSALIARVETLMGQIQKQ